MLVISRKHGESIVVDTPEGRITFVLLGQMRNAAKIGVEAPHDFAISRGEAIKTIPREPVVIARQPEVSPDGKTLTWRTGRTVMVVRLDGDEVTTEVQSHFQ